MMNRATFLAISFVAVFSVACGDPSGLGGGVTSLQISLVPPPVGNTMQLKAVAIFSDETTEDVTTQARWTSNNSSVATVSDAGLVTNHPVLGSTRIIAHFKGAADTMTVTHSAVP